MPEQLPLFSQPPEPAPEEVLLESPERPALERPDGTGAARPEAGRLSTRASLNSATHTWLAHLKHLVDRNELSPHTPKAFGGDLKQLANFLGANKSIGEVTTRDLNNWLEWQRTVKRISPKTYARRITTLKSFFRWLHETGAVANDPAAPIVQQTVISPLPEVLSEAEVQSALAAAQALRTGEKPDLRPYVLFTLLLQTGIKKAECLALVPNHVDYSNPDEPVVWVRHADPRHRYRERKLRLEPSWVPVYREYLAQYEPRDKLFPWSARRLEYLLEDITKAAGLEKHISFDMCRWTCAVRDARAGMEFDRIRQKLGLSKIQWREIGMKLRKLVEPAL